MNEPKLSYPFDFCPDFPVVPPNEVARDHLLEGIKRMFVAGARTVSVDGEEGIGTTTLLAQFVRRYPQRTIAAFIRPISRLAYAPDYLRTVLGNQIAFLLGDDTNANRVVEPSDYFRLMTRLARDAGGTKGPVYFIVDGWEQIPAQDELAKKILFTDLLPSGSQRFCLLLSGNANQIAAVTGRQLAVTNFRLIGLSLHETAIFLAGLNLSPEQLRSAWEMSHGFPANLASLRRLLESGMTLDNLLAEDVSRLPDFLALEWQKISNVAEGTRNALAVVAFGRQPFVLKDLARIVASSESDLQKNLSETRIIEVDSSTTEIRFLSEAHRRIAAKQLAHLRPHALNLIVDDLLKNQQQSNSLALLPSYLNESGRYEVLLDYLNAENLVRVLRDTRSLGAVRQHVELGVDAANRVQSVRELIRFTLQKALLKDIYGHKPWLSEIRARVATADYGSALSIAQEAVTLEGRLQLLALYSRALQEKEMPVDQAVREEIDECVKRLDPVALGPLVMDIAFDLAAIAPDHAIQMVEQAVGRGGGQALDEALFALTIEAARSKEIAKTGEALERARAAMQDESVRKLSNAVSSFFAGSSGPDVIRKARELQPRTRFYFLKQWLLAHRTHLDVLLVIDNALDELIRDTAYTPTARDLRELAVPLAHGNHDPEKIRALIVRFDSQKGTVQQLSATEEYVRLQMLLGAAASKSDPKAAKARVDETLELLEKITSVPVYAQSLAWVFGGLDRIAAEGGGVLGETEYGAIRAKLKQAVDTLLANTAEQFGAVSSVLSALARAHLTTAVEIADRLNTEARRNRAYSLIIRVMLWQPKSGSRFADIVAVLKKISDTEQHDMLCVAALEDIQADDVVDNTFLSWAMEEAPAIANAHSRCQVFAHAATIVAKRWPEKSDVIAELTKRLTEAWTAIDRAWEKVDLGFTMVAILAEQLPDSAKELVGKVEQVKTANAIRVDDAAETLNLCLRLVIRSFAGLVPKRVYAQEYLDDIKGLLSEIPSSSVQASLWSELALRCFASGDTSLSKRIVDQYLIPAVESISPNNVGLKYELLQEVMPALYCAHANSAKDILRTLPRHVRNDAAYLTIRFLVTRTPPTDQQSQDIVEFQHVTYGTLLDVCDLLNFVDEDASIFGVVSDISAALSVGPARDRLTHQQKADIAQKLVSVVETRLPDSHNIKHDGFKIAALAKIYRWSQRPPQDFLSLQDRARAIDNIADRGLVLAFVGLAMPGRLAKERQALLRESLKTVAEIPDALDQSDRYEWIARLAEVDEPAFAREALRLGMRASVAVDNDREATKVRAEILDCAHRLDPGFAETLGRMMDEDPARSRVQQEVAERLGVLDTKKKLASSADIGSNIEKIERQLPRAARMNLASLNAGRQEPQKLEGLLKYVRMSNELDLDDLVAVLAWILENANRRLGPVEDQARLVLVPLFEATLRSAFMAARIIVSLTDARQSAQEAAAAKQPDRTLMFRENDREAFLAYLRRWLSQQSGAWIKICDPYFGPGDILMLRMLQSEKPECRATVLCGRRHLLQHASVEALFQTEWRRVSDAEPPDTEIVVAGMEPHGDCPIHDRWIVSNDSGLLLGTSLGSVGDKKVSNVSILSREDAVARVAEMDQYVLQKKRMHAGSRVRYTAFTL